MPHALECPVCFNRLSTNTQIHTHGHLHALFGDWLSTFPFSRANHIFMVAVLFSTPALMALHGGREGVNCNMVAKMGKMAIAMVEVGARWLLLMATRWRQCCSQWLALCQNVIFMDKCVLFMSVSFNRMSNRIAAQDVDDGYTGRTCDGGQYMAANAMTAAGLLCHARLAAASLVLLCLRCDIVMNSPQWISLVRR